MVSRPSSPSQLRGDAEGIYPLPVYNTHPYVHSEDPTHSQAMGKLHNSLDIVLPSDRLYLRGTGIDVEPCILQGSVVLNLVEATTFKEITMQFRGKSRVPNMQVDGASVLGGSYQTNVIFVHDWSFLEGDRKHTPTLKAGRHEFPFQLSLEGWLPSSLSVHGGAAGINYKLRATAVRPVFASNFHASATVRILRSFAPGALEYQQTLEVENTWPGKMMYSLMVPHKAWAGGDTVTTLVKFSPLLKGVRITSITSTVQEHVKTFTRAGPPHEEMRVIAMAKHEIRDGHAVTMQLTEPGKGVSVSPPRRTPPRPTTPISATPSDGVRTPALEAPSSIDPFAAGAQQILNGTSVPGTPPAEGGEGNILGSTEHEHTPATDESLDRGEEEVVTTLPLTLPVSSTPSHGIEPIMVTHRIRWSILMSNLDGHTSELRCSLPLYILDHTLLDDARIATCVTRRLLLGLDDTQSNPVEEMELPSYPSHVLDRVANAYLPATVRVSNPWVNRPSQAGEGGSMRSRGPSFSVGLTLSPASPSTHITPRDTPPLTPGETAPGARGDVGGVALDWVNSELHRLDRAGQRMVTPPDSTQTSRHASRASSRAASLERGTGNGRSDRERERERERSHHHHSIFSLRPFTKVASSLHTGHGRHQSTDSTQNNHASTSASSSTQPSPTHPDSPASAQDDPEFRGMELLSRAFSEVPHYDVASRGFLGGGVTPLSSMQGLPSYEEAERSQSDGDLAARFAAARSRQVSAPGFPHAVEPASR